MATGTQIWQFGMAPYDMKISSLQNGIRASCTYLPANHQLVQADHDIRCLSYHLYICHWFYTPIFDPLHKASLFSNIETHAIIL